MILRSRLLTPTLVPLTRSLAGAAIAQFWRFSRFYGRSLVAPVRKHRRNLAAKPDPSSDTGIKATLPRASFG